MVLPVLSSVGAHRPYESRVVGMMVERIKAYAHDTPESIVHLINYKDTTFVLFCDEILGVPHQSTLLISRSYSSYPAEGKVSFS